MKNSISRLFAGLVLITTTAAPIPDYTAADHVLGQANFTSSGAADPPTASSLNAPTSVVVDPVTRKVLVADSDNYRQI
jgi:hypothetical protein